MKKQSEDRLVMMRKGKMKDLDRSFDLDFWQAQSDTDRFEASWELIRLTLEKEDIDGDKFRLQRSVENFQRL